jgi:hypothetical protein
MEEPLLLTHGFKPKLIAGLVDAGLATKTAERSKGGASPIYHSRDRKVKSRRAIGRSALVGRHRVWQVMTIDRKTRARADAFASHILQFDDRSDSTGTSGVGCHSLAR